MSTPNHLIDPQLLHLIQQTEQNPLTPPKTPQSHFADMTSPNNEPNSTPEMPPKVIQNHQNSLAWNTSHQQAVTPASTPTPAALVVSGHHHAYQPAIHASVNTAFNPSATPLDAPKDDAQPVKYVSWCIDGLWQNNNTDFRNGHDISGDGGSRMTTALHNAYPGHNPSLGYSSTAAHNAYAAYNAYDPKITASDYVTPYRSTDSMNNGKLPIQQSTAQSQGAPTSAHEVKLSGATNLR